MCWTISEQHSSVETPLWPFPLFLDAPYNDKGWGLVVVRVREGVAGGWGCKGSPKSRTWAMVLP